MKAVVLGAAGGGGFPQWNSNAAGCRRARAGDLLALPRTQASIAISGDGEHWYLLNAAPDLRQQIGATPELYPSSLRHNSATRSTPIAGMILTGGDVDVIAGLLSLRERQAFTLYATARIHAVLDANSIFEVLARDVVPRAIMKLDTPVALAGGLTVALFAVPGKVPLYLEQDDTMPEIALDETTVAALVTDGSRRLFYIPGCAMMTPELAARLDGADAVFFDGTLWRDDEMVVAGLSAKTGRRMGHMSLSGADGTIAAFESIAVKRKIIIHINNSNPVLLADSPERTLAVEAGWTVAEDGMRIEI